MNTTKNTARIDALTVARIAGLALKHADMGDIYDFALAYLTRAMLEDRALLTQHVEAMADRCGLTIDEFLEGLP